jgi:predicted ABC-class ATPase
LAVKTKIAMQDTKILQDKIKAINGKDYGAYQNLLGACHYPTFKLSIEQIPKDPYAPPHTGIYVVQVPYGDADYMRDIASSKIKEVAFRDFVARRFYAATVKISKGRRGTGFSGVITIDEPGQSVLERSSVVINNEFIEVRFFMGLPASGRKVEASIAEKMFFEELPKIVEIALLKENMDMKGLQQHINTVETAAFIRDQLEPLGLVAFISEDSILPRTSGTSDKPLAEKMAVPFHSPPNLSVEIELPDGGKVKGMGIPRGITLITGGGYHGKSTLLKGIELGIYNHIPGDGREKCISHPETIKIRSYSGRSVEKVDISLFIRNLPFGKETNEFSTENASGSTSQAASIMEAIEAGAKVLLMDEDTCATNFMIRDEKMQRLVPKEDEPITTFIDRARKLYFESGISTILVLGGAGDYFDVSDKVIQMNRYVPIDVTGKAKEISQGAPAKRKEEDTDYPISLKQRIPFSDSFDPYNEYHKKSVYATEVHRLKFGKTFIDLTDVEQLIEIAQTKAIGEAILYVIKDMSGKSTLKDIIDRLMDDLDRKGLDVLSRKKSGHLARFRGLELALAINRLRGLKVEQKKLDPATKEGPDLSRGTQGS